MILFGAYSTQIVYKTKQIAEKVCFLYISLFSVQQSSMLIVIQREISHERSEPIRITMIFRNGKLPKLKKKTFIKRKIEKALLNIVLNLFLPSIYIAPNYITAKTVFLPPPNQNLINSFIIFFGLQYCVQYLCREQRSHRSLLKVF